MITFKPLQKLDVTRTTLVIPAFTIPTTWTGISNLIGRFLIGNTSPFSFKLPIDAVESYVLAVSYTEDGTIWYRYKLWEGVGEILEYPVYNGESLGANAVLEIWNVKNATAATGADGSLEISELNYPILCPRGQVVTSSTTLSLITPTTHLPGDNNPFTVPLVS